MSIYQTKLRFDLGPKIDKNNAYMKFERNLLIECLQMQMDRWQPFSWPSWLAFIGQNPCSNFLCVEGVRRGGGAERLIKVYCIYNI